MNSTVKNLIEMATAILADATEPEWRHEQARAIIDRYGYAAKKAEAEEATRKTLLAAAREARKMGFAVKSSKARDGQVSSYYASRDDGRPVRISDHALPQTAKREAQADFHGGSAFAGEIIIDREMNATRLRRLIILAAAGR